MGLTIFGAVADMTGVLAKVDAAKAAADNARQMVLNRDATLNQASADATQAVGQYTSLDALSQSYVTALGVSQADRAALHTELNAAKAAIAALQAVSPIKGDKGDAGPAGTANLAVCARPVAALLLGASTNVTLPWSRAMPNTTYSCQFAHSAVIDAANVTITVVTKTTTSVTVTVKSVGLALVAGTIVGTGW